MYEISNSLRYFLIIWGAPHKTFVADWTQAEQYTPKPVHYCRNMNSSKFFAILTCFVLKYPL